MPIIYVYGHKTTNLGYVGRLLNVTFGIKQISLKEKYIYKWQTQLYQMCWQGRRAVSG